MPQEPNSQTDLRMLPSVDLIMRTAIAVEMANDLGHEGTLSVVRAAIERLRDESEGHAIPSREAAIEKVEQYLHDAAAKRSQHRLRRVINATGIIVHTNLGRSPLSAAAIDAIKAASGYCNLEFDLATGERGRRGAAAENLLAEITGAEDAVIVNNCAAAALLVLSTLAIDGEVIVSRGELVEIGGDFRIPDVLERSGAKLREVGTTNRTKIADYERAISDQTKLILRVHPSNYRITGFTETPELSDLAALAHTNGFHLFEDAGSGMLTDLSDLGLGDEPLIRTSIAAGVDVGSFSGDKLMGGVQAGLIVGRRELIDRLRANPLYRALRVNKIVYAAIDATLSIFARGSARDDIPALAMLSMTLDDLNGRAWEFVTRAKERLGDSVGLEIVRGNSAIGGGAAPGLGLPTALVAVTHPKLSANRVAAEFRKAEPPVIARVSDDKLLIDLRTVTVDDEPHLIEALAATLQ